MDDNRNIKGWHKESPKSTNFGGFNKYPGAKIARMKKDTRLTFRVSSHLKKDVEAIATREGQSVARICEAFLLAGSDTYKKQGTKFLERMLGRVGTKPADWLSANFAVAAHRGNDVAEKAGSSVSDRNNPAARSRAVWTAP
jgi:hypothetical protein